MNEHCMNNFHAVSVGIKMKANTLILTVPVTTIDALRHFETG